MDIGRIKHLICGHIKWLSTCKFLFSQHEVINDLHLHTRVRCVLAEQLKVGFINVSSFYGLQQFVLIMFLFLYYTCRVG